MGHIKLAKASGKFDIVSADGVAAVKLITVVGTDKIQISYSSGTNAVIEGTASGGTPGIVQDDVFTVVKAIDLMEGASGPAPLVSLSTAVSAVDATLIT